jgi:hypothetical protein
VTLYLVFGVGLIEQINQMMHDNKAGRFIGMQAGLYVCFAIGGLIAVMDGLQRACISQTGSRQGILFYGFGTHGSFARTFLLSF